MMGVTSFVVDDGTNHGGMVKLKEKKSVLYNIISIFLRMNHSHMGEYVLPLRAVLDHRRTTMLFIYYTFPPTAYCLYYNITLYILRSFQREMLSRPEYFISFSLTGFRSQDIVQYVT